MNTTPDKPNILLICADQWRWDCMSGLGHPNVRTPNIDALAKDGVLFKNHFGQCTPCGPSRTSLLTGLYLMNHRSGRNGTPLDARHTNVALEARKAGYDPSLFGYTDTSPDPRGKHPNDPALTAYDEGVLVSRPRRYNACAGSARRAAICTWPILRQWEPILWLVCTPAALAAA